MPIVSQKLGPGTLKLGTGGGIQDVSFQVLNCRVEASEEVKKTDEIYVLGGDTLPAEESAAITYRLKGTLLQNLLSTGAIAWTYANKGTTQQFEFIPNTAAARKVTGNFRVVPLTIGGEASKTDRPKSDFDWSITDVPVFAAAP